MHGRGTARHYQHLVYNGAVLKSLLPRFPFLRSSCTEGAGPPRALVRAHSSAWVVIK